VGEQIEPSRTGNLSPVAEDLHAALKDEPAPGPDPPATSHRLADPSFDHRATAPAGIVRDEPSSQFESEPPGADLVEGAPQLPAQIKSANQEGEGNGKSGVEARSRRFPAPAETAKKYMREIDVTPPAPPHEGRLSLPPAVRSTGNSTKATRVEIHIGTIEVRAQSEPAADRSQDDSGRGKPESRSNVFENYGQLRNYQLWRSG
jgi:hypothetical protein